MPDPILDKTKISTVVSKLKCDICQNYLSVFPVLLSTNGENICGRCSSNYEGVPTTRVLIYETLAESLFFPCCYRPEGCSIQEIPEEITKHEEICPFRVVSCPIPSCSWKGFYSVANWHCQDVHTGCFLQQNVEFTVPQSNEYQHNMISENNKIILVASKYHSAKKLLQYSVYYPYYERETTEITCQIILKFGKRTLIVELDVTTFDDFDLTDISVSGLIKDKSDLRNVKGVIDLSTTVNNERLSSQEKTNYDLLSVLKCDKCEKYVLPPIYEDLKGILCGRCRLTQSSSNVTLNKLANLVIYPCPFENLGCSFSAKPSKMEVHQAECDYRSTECPDCGWEGIVKDLASHFRINHSTSDMTGEYKDLSFEDSELYGTINYNDHLFYLDLGVIGDIFYCTVEAIESQDIGYYQYEIQVVDTTASNQKIILRNICDRLLTSSERFKTPKTYFTLNKEQLKHFIRADNTFDIETRVFPFIN